MTCSSRRHQSNSLATGLLYEAASLAPTPPSPTRARTPERAAKIIVTDQPPAVLPRLDPPRANHARLAGRSIREESPAWRNGKRSGVARIRFVARSSVFHALAYRVAILIGARAHAWRSTSGVFGFRHATAPPLPPCCDTLSDGCLTVRITFRPQGNSGVLAIQQTCSNHPTDCLALHEARPSVSKKKGRSFHRIAQN